MKISLGKDYQKCKDLKFQTMLKKCKQIGFEEDVLTQYLNGKKFYYKTLKAKKNEYLTTRNEILSEVGTLKPFWALVRSLRSKWGQTCLLSPTDWLLFFRNRFPLSVKIMVGSQGVECFLRQQD